MSTANDIISRWRAEKTAKAAQFRVVRVRNTTTYWVNSGGVEYKIVHEHDVAEGHWNQYQIYSMARGRYISLDNEGATYKRVLSRLKAALASGEAK